MGAVVLGAAAYEMGNLLGAVAGIQLIFNVPAWILVICIATTAFFILNIPSLKIISTILGFLVVIMGLGFLITAILIKPSLNEIFAGAVIPKWPNSNEAGILVLGLIGTTIVPYNLFLGSGISNQKQSVKEMRFGLATAVILGGIFSMAVLIVGTTVISAFSFDELSVALQGKIGISGKYLLGFGLFAAGFTSAVTAPLAAAITLKSLFGNKNPEKWGSNSINYKLGWLVVLITGIVFSVGNIKPIPAIVAAQAFNGFLLPVVAIFLFKTINNKSLLLKNTNTIWLNIFTIVVIFITLILGLNSASKAFYATFFSEILPGKMHLIFIAGISLLISLIVWISTISKNK